MDQALGDVPFNSIRAVRQLDIGESWLFVYGYDDKRPDQFLSPNSLAHIRVFHGASLIRVPDPTVTTCSYFVRRNGRP
jgi:hypothetical protein